MMEQQVEQPEGNLMRVVCTLPVGSTEIGGVRFAKVPVKGHLWGFSARIPEDRVKAFCRVPGFEVYAETPDLEERIVRAFQAQMESSPTPEGTDLAEAKRMVEELRAANRAQAVEIAELRAEIEQTKNPPKKPEATSAEEATGFSDNQEPPRRRGRQAASGG